MAENILTRKYGGVPGWAIGGGAVVVGLAFFYFRSKGQSTSSTQQTQQSAANNPAASSIPYVPNVTLTGIPSSSSAANNAGSPGQSGTSTTTVNATVIGAQNGAMGAGARSGPGFGSPVVARIPPGSQIQIDQTPLNTDAAGYNWFHVVGGNGQGLYVYSPEVAITGPVGSGGGQGGWGQAGTTNPVVFMGTTAWNWGGTAYPQAGAILSQRAGRQTTGSGGRFDYGGAGGGSSNTRNTNRARDQKPLKKHKLTRR